MHARRWWGWGRVVVLGLAVVAACSSATPGTATRGALRIQDENAARAEALTAVREAVVGWKGGPMPEWSPQDRAELDAALGDIERAIGDAHRWAKASSVAPAAAGTGPEARVVFEDTADVDPRTLYRQQGHRYELVVRASQSWLATDGEDASAGQRHLLEAGLRAAKMSVFRLPTLEKQLLRQES